MPGRKVPLAQALWRVAYGNGGQARKDILRSLLTGGIPFCYYWTWAMLFWLLDRTRKPSILYQHKIQKKKKTLEPRAMLRVVKDVMYHQLVTLGAFAVLTYPLLRRRIRVSKNLPSIPELIRDVLISYSTQSVLFYYLHRFFHTPTMYR